MPANTFRTQYFDIFPLCHECPFILGEPEIIEVLEADSDQVGDIAELLIGQIIKAMHYQSLDDSIDEDCLQTIELNARLHGGYSSRTGVFCLIAVMGGKVALHSDSQTDSLKPAHIISNHLGSLVNASSWPLVWFSFPALENNFPSENLNDTVNAITYITQAPLRDLLQVCYFSVAKISVVSSL